MRYLIGSFFLFVSFIGLSQNDEFKSVISELQSNLLEVQTGDETYTHEIEHLGYSVLKYTLVEVDEKGNREEIAYEFNVADLDPYVVREETKKDIIYLSLTVDNGQKFIKVYENGEVKGYDENMLMVTKNIDNARIMKDFIKKAIPMAEEIMTNKLKVETYPEMESWLEEHVVNAESSGKSYNQQLVALDDFPGNFRLIQTEITAKSSEEKQYIFNLSDININSLKFNISGSSFSLDFETNRKQKVIKVLENGVPDGFDDEIEIFTNNVEEARDLKNILTLAVPLAEDKVEASIQKFDALQPALDYLGKFVQNIDYGDESFEQSVEGDCLMKFARIESDEKSTEKLTAEFNLIDVNGNLIDYDVSSGKMYVEFTTKESLDLIKTYENDEFDGYDDELKIYAENVEVARRIKAVLEDLIKVCERDYIDPFADMTLEQKIGWLTENMEEVRNGDETITQTFERIDDSDPDKIKLTKLEVDAKGGQEEIFEFNFTDLNPKSIQYDIGSKTLAVSFETKFKEDIIKYYKDGEIENYQDGFELSLADIETARNVILVFNQIIAELNE
ncbi:hypothetical protein AAOE16_05985 [Ekhidna sp. MALMAid0563]|uniref:hypothetical protein n=1 Tax=Ekhidna sp. MALMAid0563 TaxID=3143937 RepID=UPI0032DFD965